MEPKSIPKDIENLMGILEASWGDLERQVGLLGGRAQRRRSRALGFGGVPLITGARGYDGGPTVAEKPEILYKSVENKKVAGHWKAAGRIFGQCS